MLPKGAATYVASDMVLWKNNGDACIVEEGLKSRAGGHYFLSDFDEDADKVKPKLNGSVHTLCKMLKSIVASASECEIVLTLDNF